MIVCYAASQSIKEERSVFVMIVRNLHRTEYNSPKVNIMVSKPFWSNFFVTHYNFTNHFQNFQIFIYVSFIPCFHHLVFGILVTLVTWFSFHFFPSCPSYLAKCEQRLCNSKNEKCDEWNWLLLGSLPKSIGDKSQL